MSNTEEKERELCVGDVDFLREQTGHLTTADLSPTINMQNKEIACFGGILHKTA